jgi:uncharacterized repeat protein (TIGR01451 family)
LRQSISDADGTAGASSIVFNIPGSGVQTIAPLTPFPAITNPITIDGYTQPGARPNDLLQGDDATLEVELTGAALTLPGPAQVGLHLSGGTSTVRGLDIHGFYTQIEADSAGADSIRGNYIGTDPSGTHTLEDSLQGVWLDAVNANAVGGISPADRNLISSGSKGLLMQDSSGNVVQGNYIGTDATGTTAIGNGTGIELNSAYNEIGGGPVLVVVGVQASAGNLISANNTGIILNGTGATNNAILGNLIGTDATGTLPLGNAFAGVALGNGAANNVIGGAGRGEGNVIGAARGIPGDPPAGVGISLGSAGSGNTVEGNAIGTDMTGTRDLGNQVAGVSFGPNGYQSLATIGGTAAGARNLIAFNGAGIVGNAGVSILGNSIYANRGAGISGSGGTSPPVLTDARTVGGSTRIEGSVRSAASSSVRVEFFASPNPGGSAPVQGQTLLGALIVPTDAAGTASIGATFSAVPAGAAAITATVTDSRGETSNFSQPVLEAADLALAAAPTPGTVRIGDSVTYTLTVTNGGTFPATGVILTDALPAGTTLISATPSEGTAARSGGAVTASLGGLDPGTSATLTIVVRANAAGSAVNTAKVVADFADPTPSDDSATQAVTVSAAPSGGGSGGGGTGGTGTPQPGSSSPRSRGPSVIHLQAVRGRRHATALQLTFDEPLDPGRALNTANYVLASAPKRPKPRRVPALATIAIRSVSLDSTGTIVTLVPASRLARRRTYSLTVHAAPATGLTDRAGHALDGGSDFVAQINGSTATIVR